MGGDGIITVGFSLVVVRHPNGKYLGVNETRQRGWWLPGGGVEGTETMEEAAVREVLEETGINVKLIGILAIQRSVEKNRSFARFKVIYFAVPKDPNESPKNFADMHSECAKWFDMKEYVALKRIRGPELIDWVEYIEKKGQIMPLNALDLEGDIKDPATFKTFNIDQVLQKEKQDDEYEITNAILLGDLNKYHSLIQQIDINTRFQKRWTLLHYAIKSQNAEIIVDLLKKGIDIYATTHKGRTALHMAAGASNPKILKLLLDLGGKSVVLVEDFEGFTVFHQAAITGKEMLEVLQKGLDSAIVSFAMSRQNHNGKTPEELSK